MGSSWCVFIARVRMRAQLLPARPCTAAAAAGCSNGAKCCARAAWRPVAAPCEQDLATRLPPPASHLPRPRVPPSRLASSGDAWWGESLKLLTDFHFLDMLLGYDKDSMTDEVAAQVGRWRVCAGVFGRLCVWACVRVRLDSAKKMRSREQGQGTGERGGCAGGGRVAPCQRGRGGFPPPHAPSGFFHCSLTTVVFLSFSDSK